MAGTKGSASQIFVNSKLSAVAGATVGLLDGFELGVALPVGAVFLIVDFPVLQIRFFPLLIHV